MMTVLKTCVSILFNILPVLEATKSSFVYYTSSGGFSPELMHCTVKMLDQHATDAEFDLTTGQCDTDPQSSSNVSSYIFLQTYEPHFQPAMDTTVDVITSINIHYPVIFEVHLPNPGVGHMILMEFNQTGGTWLTVQTEFDALYINTAVDTGSGMSNHTTTNNTFAGHDVIVQISVIFSNGVTQVFLDTQLIVQVLVQYQPQLKTRFYSNFATCNRVLYIWRVQRLNYI